MPTAEKSDGADSSKSFDNSSIKRNRLRNLCLRELRKKLKAAQARAATAGMTGHEEAAVAMEELEKSKDGQSVNAVSALYVNPIHRSDEVETND